MTTAAPRYAFGKNWTSFVKKDADDQRIALAKRHLLEFAQRQDLAGIDFLDVGCGSGIHSLAAWQARARRIKSFDYDPQSVGATEIMRKRATDASNWTVERGDVLDENYVASLGKWDFVYAWGVLHHTGDVWRAIDNTSKLVAGDGTLYLALYSADVQADPEFWIEVKRQYNRSSQWKRWRLEWWYIWVFVLGRNPRFIPQLFRRIAERKFRGMSFFADIRDWLGGWPMEFTRDDDVVQFLNARGFFLANIKTGEACTEFLFRKNGGVGR